MALGMVAEKNSVWRFLRQQADDAAQIVDEAQIEHLIGFVEDEDFNEFQVKAAALDQIEQPAGGGDDDIDAALHRTLLARNRHAAEHRGDGEFQIFAIIGERLGDLRHQLAGRRQHEDAGGGLEAVLGIGGEAMQDRQRKGCGLAGAGLGDTAQVMAFHGGADRLDLDRGGNGIALVGKRARQAVRRGRNRKIESWFFFCENTRDGIARLPAMLSGGTSGFLTTRVMG